MKNQELEELERTRERLSVERRKNSSERIVKEKRMKFLDMSELLQETSMIETQDFSRSMPRSKAEILSKINTEKRVEFWQFVSAVSDLEIKINGADRFVLIWREVCSWESALRITQQFLTKQPALPPVKTYQFNQILIAILNLKIDLENYKILLKCLKVIPEPPALLKEHFNILNEYLSTYRADYFSVTNTISLINQIINQIDEDTQSTLISLINFTSISIQFVNTTEQPLLELILSSISSCVLHGPQIVNVLISSQFLRQSILVFEQSNVRIKNLLIVIVYNTILVGERVQLIYLIENHLIDLVHYCIGNFFSMDCLHLCLKMCDKVLTFIEKIKGEYTAEGLNQIFEFIKINDLYSKMVMLQGQRDEYVREEALKIGQKIESLVGMESMATEQ